MDCNTTVTVDCNKQPHMLSKQLRKTYDKGYHINMIEGRPFSYHDFEMKPGTFRQHVLRLKPYVELVYRDHVSFYKIKGITLPGDSHRVTTRHTGEAIQLIQQLERLEDQPRKIHDIKLRVDSSIHYDLQKKGCSVNPHNHSILVNIAVSDDSMNIKALVYPKTIQIDIGCSYKPIIYDIESLLYLQEILTEASIYLSMLSKQKLPPVKDWIVTHYHLNKDGNFEINGKSFHFTFASVTTGLIRFYSKKMKDGKTIPRIEKIVTPKIPFSQMMVDTIED